MSTTSSNARFAPLVGRLRVMTVARIAIVLATVLLLPTLSRLQNYEEVRATIALASAAYIGVNLLILIVLRSLPGATRRALDVSLVADASWAIAVLWPTAGVYSPLLFLLYLQLIAATVLFSWRTGFKLAVLHTIGFLWLLIQRSGELGATGFVIGGVEVSTVVGLGDELARTAALVQAVFNLVSIWVVLGATAYFSSVNERDLRRSNRELAVLRELNTQLERSLELTDVSQAIAQGVVRELGYARAVVWMAQAGGELVAAGADGFAPDDLELLGDLRLTIGPGPVGRAVETREVQLVAREHARPAALADAFEIDSPLVIVPLSSEGRLLGLLTVEVARPIGRSPRVKGRDVRILGTLATEASLALDNARLHAELRDLATTDALTGVYNHRYFQQRLQEELDRGIRRVAGGAEQPVSLILMDIDHFKTVNDRFGHPSGDELLRSLARLIERVLRSSDVVCRYGGEEFGIILPDADHDQAAQVAERLREAIERSNFMGADGRYLGQVTASFGIATFIEGLPSRSDLIAKADEALYVAKELGRNRVVRYLDGETQETSAGRQREAPAVAAAETAPVARA